MRTMTGRYSLCGEGLCIGYDGGDAVSKEYKTEFESLPICSIFFCSKPEE